MVDPMTPTPSPAKQEAIPVITPSQRRNAEADALLASLSEQQIRTGLRRGIEMLAMLDADQCIAEEDIHDRIGHPSQHPTKDHVAYMQSDYEWKKRHLNSAIADTRAELARRGIEIGGSK